MKVRATLWTPKPRTDEIEVRVNPEHILATATDRSIPVFRNADGERRKVGMAERDSIFISQGCLCAVLELDELPDDDEVPAATWACLQHVDGRGYTYVADKLIDIELIDESLSVRPGVKLEMLAEGER
jgi:hypothetical protein